MEEEHSIEEEDSIEELEVDSEDEEEILKCYERCDLFEWG